MAKRMMGTIAVAALALATMTGCGDREAEIIGAIDPLSASPAACGLWGGNPSPGKTADGWTDVFISPTFAKGGAGLELWTPGANRWGYPWNGGASLSNVPASCFVTSFSIGAWSQSGNSVIVDDYVGPNGTHRFDMTGVIRDACEPGYAGGLYCSANFGPDQQVMEAVLHDRLAPPGCAARYHLVLRFVEPSGECR